ncbi:m-AAA protease-interacting protein 1, mitochondrial [Gouania willdenowi]|uniref:Matrix AAA peptidase interacting protein 1 n=1 Tax=Gouania willdenowi TaxID=441366 RepID=A0A8C5G3Q3_GOUWI|nr:m-AAA protease-interacting protein 1, mitochondrial [Gouania willdenowi]
MALTLFRGCSRLSSSFNVARLCLNEGSTLSMSRKRRLSVPSIAASTVRPYSSEWKENKQKVVVVNIPHPLMWVRTQFYYFLIRTYFDKEFSIEEFTEGAKQAFSHVSRLLSQCQFEALEGLVAKDLIGRLKEKCNSLPLSYSTALSAESDDIMYTSSEDVGIFYDDNGRKFVSILMRFWYLTSAQLPDDNIEGARIFKVAIGEGAGEAETKKMLSALYEFQREFTKGVPPDWTITRIEHSKLLD